MKRLFLAVVATVSAVLAITAEPVQAAAGSPTQVAFDVLLTFTNPPDHPPCRPTTPCTAAGTFYNASQPLCPSGYASDVYVFPGGQRDRTYICADGSGSLKMNVEYRRFFSGPTPDSLLITGRWEIVGGTGSMANIHGQGNVTSIFVPGVDGTLTEANTGDVVLTP